MQTGNGESYQERRKWAFEKQTKRNMQRKEDNVRQQEEGKEHYNSKTIQSNKRMEHKLSTSPEQRKINKRVLTIIVQIC